MSLPVAVKSAIKTTLLAAMLIKGSLAISQLKADFTADQLTGCSPLAVAFTNTTSGASSSVTYQWDLGNGNTSANINPGAVYTDEKTYTVTLTVKDGSQTSTKSLQVIVYKKPVVDFTSSLIKGCAPLATNLMINASAGDGSITGYVWDFGDGNTSNTQATQAAHTYTFGLKATVSLIAKNSFGCYSILKKQEYIDVQPAIKPAFSTGGTICNAADTVKFINTTTGPVDMTYVWDFGDGTTSTSLNSNHVYNSKGAFTAKLTINSGYGCTGTTTSVVNVANFISDFSVPSIICPNNQNTFINKSSPQPTSSTWLVDNVVSSTNIGSDTAKFSAPGVHTIRLVNTFGTCYDSVLKTITVAAPPVLNDFITNQLTACGAPVTVQLKDTSATTVKWVWDFSYPFSNNSSTDREAFALYTNDATYQVSLTAANAEGCTSTKTKTIIIAKPVVTVSIIKSTGISLTAGCTGNTITFAASPANLIKQYNWDFGDSTTSSNATPAHVYTKAGNYNISLHYTTIDQCDGMAYFSLTINENPHVDFDAPATICGNTLYSFFAKTNTSTHDIKWFWNFGDSDTLQPAPPDCPSISNCQSSALTQHQYKKDSTYSITLIGAYPGCADTIVKKNIRVLPVFPWISSFTYTCDGTRGLVTFKDTSKYISSATWDFGDPLSGNNTTTWQAGVPVSHTYTKTGEYQVFLKPSNTICQVRDSVRVFVLLKQSPVLSADNTQLCSPAKLTIRTDSLENNPRPQPKKGDDYSFLGVQYENGLFLNPSFTTPLVNPYAPNLIDTLRLPPGDQKFRIIIRSAYYGCNDTSNYVPLKVNGPVANFKIPQSSICNKTSALFIDSSYVPFNAPLKTWVWNFGDGTSLTLDSSSTLTHKYTTPRSYNVSLSVVDVDGCSTTATKVVTVNGPQAAFTYTPPNVSPTTLLTFTNRTITTNTPSPQYLWSFGDGSTSSATSPTHAYTAYGTDTVQLIAKSAVTGCADTAKVVVSVKNFHAAFTYKTSYVNSNTCPPVLVSFTNTSQYAAGIMWNFGDGGRAYNQNTPTHIYNQPGVYYISIVVTDANGLKDSTVDSITIRGATARIKTDVISGCLGQTITFNADVKNATSYIWDFADGTINLTKDTFAVHQYSTPGVYTPSLLLKDVGSCWVTSETPQRIVIDSLNFKVNHSPGIICDSSKVFFTAVVNSIAADQMHQALKYHWSFGTGNAGDTSNVQSPIFTFNKRTKFPVKLSITSPYGCMKEVTDTVEVYQKPKGKINGPADICEAASATFIGSADVSNVQWKWDFKNGATSLVQNPPAQPYNTPGNYDVALIVENGSCYDTSVSKLVVHAKPVINLLPKQAAICAGKSVQLSASGGGTYVWTNIAGLSNYSIANPIASPQQTTQYSVEVTNSYGCKNTDTVMVQVGTPFKIKTSADTIVCIGKSVQLAASGASSYTWINNTVGLSNTGIANPVAKPSSTTQYTVVGYDNAQCFTDTALVQVMVSPLPTVNAGADVQTAGGAPVQLTAAGSSDVIKWNWSPPDYLSCIACAATTATPVRDMAYVITGKNNYGCAASDTVLIQLMCNQSQVYIPTSFTPNGDYKNDLFYIKGGGVKKINFLKIYNRFGEAVFEKTNFNINDPSSGWNGNFKGMPAPTGAYIYFTEMICEGGETFSFKGTVVLVR